MKIQLKLAAALASLLVSGASLASTGQDILKSQCISCHAVLKPTASSVDRVLGRKGPDLYYAGAKFNKEWLVAWLQKPTVIRAGGPMFLDTVKPGAAGAIDFIDTAKVQPHPKLSADDASAAAEALMAMTGDGIVQKGAFKNDPPNASMAALLFNKLRGCASCHSAKPGAGGVSGPELLTAGDRLQPDFIADYIKNPQKFDPHVWMPRLDLNDGDIQKLTGYLTTLKQGAPK